MLFDVIDVIDVIAVIAIDNLFCLAIPHRFSVDDDMIEE